MPITLTLPSVLATHAGGVRTLAASGRTLGEAVADVAARYPTLGPRLRDKDGNPYPFVVFYLNVLVVQIEDDERVGIAVLVAEARSERGVTRRHVRNGLAERATASGQRANAARVGREHRGKGQRDGHGTVS